MYITSQWHTVSELSSVRDTSCFMTEPEAPDSQVSEFDWSVEFFVSLFIILSCNLIFFDSLPTVSYMELNSNTIDDNTI